MSSKIHDAKKIMLKLCPIEEIFNIHDAHVFYECANLRPNLRLFHNTAKGTE